MKTVEIYAYSFKLIGGDVQVVTTATGLRRAKDIFLQTPAPDGEYTITRSSEKSPDITYKNPYTRKQEVQNA